MRRVSTRRLRDRPSRERFGCSLLEVIGSPKQGHLGELSRSPPRRPGGSCDPVGADALLLSFLQKVEADAVQLAEAQDTDGVQAEHGLVASEGGSLAQTLVQLRLEAGHLVAVRPGYDGDIGFRVVGQGENDLAVLRLQRVQGFVDGLAVAVAALGDDRDDLARGSAAEHLGPLAVRQIGASVDHCRGGADRAAPGGGRLPGVEVAVVDVLHRLEHRQVAVERVVQTSDAGLPREQLVVVDAADGGRAGEAVEQLFQGTLLGVDVALEPFEAIVEPVDDQKALKSPFISSLFFISSSFQPSAFL